MKEVRPIGVFDSGIGGLTVLKAIVNLLPQYDYIYLGDNARSPYGSRSFETVYQYTLQSAKKLFELNCQLIILACNTASAKALRNIQQLDLEKMAPGKRVLGVIRPTSEVVGKYTKTKHIGIVGTKGTVQSGSYKIEVKKFFPEVTVYQQACPMLVPLVENGESASPAADYFIEKYVNELFAQSSKIDTLILGCTHYPILLEKFRQHLPGNVTILSQGELVASSLKDYLLRHPEIENNCTKLGTTSFYTTDLPEDFERLAELFWDKRMEAKQVEL